MWVFNLVSIMATNILKLTKNSAQLLYIKLKTAFCKKGQNIRGKNYSFIPLCMYKLDLCGRVLFQVFDNDIQRADI